MKPARRAPRHAAVAAAISVAVHAALLLALVRARPAGEGREAMRVELVTVQAEPPTPTAPQAPSARPSATASATRTASRSATASPNATPTPAASPAATPGAPASPHLAWLRDHGLAPAPPSPAPPTLVTPVPREWVPPARDPGEEADRVLSDLAADARALDIARHPDASWMGLRDQLLAGFAPGFDVLEATSGGGVADFLGDAAVAWAASAERYGRSSSPLLPSASAPGAVAEAKAAAARASASGDRERTELLAWGESLAGATSEEGAWTRRLVTAIALEHDAEGRVVSARVVAGSASAPHDRLALAQALALVGRIAPARLASATTEWAFVTDFSIVPPVPVVGVGFDAHFRPTRPVYPLRRSTRTKVSLLAVRRAGRGTRGPG